LGDGIQAAKAGILEVGDVFVVNKADRGGVEQTVRDLRMTVRLAGHGPGEWRQPIVTTVASRGEGIGELVETIEKHRVWASESGEIQRRRIRRVRDEIEAVAVTELRRRFVDLHGDERLDSLAQGVLSGEEDPYSAAEKIIAAMT
jgi:LAO/AO transport system kinase